MEPVWGMEEAGTLSKPIVAAPPIAGWTWGRDLDGQALSGSILVSTAMIRHVYLRKGKG
jgi:hypothetical protein